MKRIMIVDDERATNALVREYLTLAGYETSAFFDARSALAAIESGEPADLAVVDRRLPDLDGVELCARLKRARSLPVLILTATGKPAAGTSGSGAPNAWMTKPFRPKELADEIRRLLGTSAA